MDWIPEIAVAANLLHTIATVDVVAGSKNNHISIV
jgi:hypothetical protein